jgi:hypothetical protein
VIIRSFDGAALDKEMRSTPALKHINVDILEWIKDDKNLALEEDGNFGVFEYNWDHVYTGHYFFHARGKEAKALSIRMLRVAFEEYGMKLVRGLTPVEHRGAVMMTRWLGFTDHGTVDTEAGECWIFTLTREEFEEKHK